MILYTSNNNSKKVFISESQLLALEGVDWNRLGNGQISMSINQTSTIVKRKISV